MELTDYQKTMYQLLVDPIVWHAASSGKTNKNQLSLGLDLLSCIEGNIDVLCGGSIPTAAGRTKADLCTYLSGLRLMNQPTLDSVNLIHAIGSTLTCSGLVYSYKPNSTVSLWWEELNTSEFSSVIVDPVPGNAFRSVLKLKVTNNGKNQAYYNLIGIKGKKGAIRVAKNIATEYPDDPKDRILSIANEAGFPQGLRSNTRFCVQLEKTRYSKAPIAFCERKPEDVYGIISQQMASHEVGRIERTKPPSFDQMAKKEIERITDQNEPLPEGEPAKNMVGLNELELMMQKLGNLFDDESRSIFA